MLYYLCCIIYVVLSMLNKYIFIYETNVRSKNNTNTPNNVSARIRPMTHTINKINNDINTLNVSIY